MDNVFVTFAPSQIIESFKMALIAAHLKDKSKVRGDF